MDWSKYLAADEEVRWEGRPAPRYFTFRNWPHSLFGLLLLGVSAYWEYFGIKLGQSNGSLILSLIPIPFLFVGIYLSVVHLILARLEWERVFYAVTDQRVLAQKGCLKTRMVDLPLEKVTYFRLNNLGKDLGTLRIEAGKARQPLILPGIEHPRGITDLLENAIKAKMAAAGE